MTWENDFCLKKFISIQDWEQQSSPESQQKKTISKSNQASYLIAERDRSIAVGKMPLVNELQVLLHPFNVGVR